MQEEQNPPGTPKGRKIRGILDRTASSVRATGSRHRSTMAPSDFALPHATRGLLPKKRLGGDRLSVLPSQMPLEGSRLDSSKTVAVDNADRELKLLYDEYLQAIMSEIIVKKKIEERKNELLVELATLAQERDHDREKLFKLQTREIDILSYTRLQNEIDAQLIEADKCTKSESMQVVNQILSQLYSCLKPLDVLHCKNIILPSTTEEWKELETVMKACVEVAEATTKLIGSKGDAYTETYNGIQEFIKSHSELDDEFKGIERPLCNLQALALKTASLSLTEEDDIMEDT